MKFYNKRLGVIAPYSIIVLMAYLIVNPVSEGTYFKFLRTVPSVYVTYLSAIILSSLLILRLPMLIRAIFRVPAFEVSKDGLVIGGWRKRFVSRSILEKSTINKKNDQQLELLISDKDESIVFDRRHIENFDELMDLISDFRVTSM